MKIKCIRNCTGIGYENFKKNQTRTVKKGLAEKLIAFGYAVEVKGKSTNSGKGSSKGNGAPEGDKTDGSIDSNPSDTDGDGDKSNENDK